MADINSIAPQNMEDFNEKLDVFLKRIKEAKAEGKEISNIGVMNTINTMYNIAEGNQKVQEKLPEDSDYYSYMDVDGDGVIEVVDTRTNKIIKDFSDGVDSTDPLNAEFESGFGNNTSSVDGAAPSTSEFGIPQVAIGDAQFGDYTQGMSTSEEEVFGEIPTTPTANQSQEKQAQTQSPNMSSAAQPNMSVPSTPSFQSPQQSQAGLQSYEPEWMKNLKRNIFPMG